MMELPTEIWVMIFSYLNMAELLDVFFKFHHPRYFPKILDVLAINFIQLHVCELKYIKSAVHNLNLAQVLSIFPYITKLSIVHIKFNKGHGDAPDLLDPNFTIPPNIKYLDLSRFKSRVNSKLDHVETLLLSYSTRMSSIVPDNTRIIYVYDKDNIPSKPTGSGIRAIRYLTYLYSKMQDEATFQEAVQYIKSMINSKCFGKEEDASCVKYCNNEYCIKMLTFLYDMYPVRMRTGHDGSDIFVNPIKASRILTNMPVHTDIIKKAINYIETRTSREDFINYGYIKYIGG